MKNKYHKEKFNAQIHTTCKIKNQSFNPTKKLTLLKIIIEFFGGRRSVDYEDGNFDRIPIVKIVRIFSFFLSSPIFVEDEVNFDNENFYSKFQTFFFFNGQRPLWQYDRIKWLFRSISSGVRRVRE